jgi:hypothetical protein
MSNWKRIADGSLIALLVAFALAVMLTPGDISIVMRLLVLVLAGLLLRSKFRL